MAGPSLQQVQKLGLHQVLAPHMQLSLHMLQVPTMELRDLIKQELEKNPTLEEIPPETVSLDQPESAEEQGPRDGRADTESEFRQEFEALKQLDDEWREYFMQSNRSRVRSADDEERRQFFFDSIVQPESLQQHLQGQLRMADASEETLDAAEIIIGSLMDDGYLMVHDDIAEQLVDFALQVCAGTRQPGAETAAWARELVMAGLAKSFEHSKRTQLIGWQERLTDICRRMRAPEPEPERTEPAVAAYSNAPVVPRTLATEPVKEHVIKLGREAMDRVHRELAEGFRAVINENVPLPIPAAVLVEAVDAGLTVAELDAVLQSGRRLDLPLLYLRPTSDTSLDTMQRALELVQTFHPVGVGARNLCECLLIQLARLDKADGIEARIIRGHFNLLASRDITKLAQALGVSPQEAQQAAENIGQLEPKPGRIFSTEPDRYVEPEVVIAKVKDDFVIMLNDDRVPHLRISDTYREMMAQENVSQEVVQYVRERIQAGKFLIRSIAQRQSTIHSIASEILRAQREFFEKGPGALKPLRMSDIAYRCGESFKMVNGEEKAVCPYCGELCDIREEESNRRVGDCPGAERDDFNRRRHRSRAVGRDVDNPRLLGVHETTVSRAIANKYMGTPWGVFEMKYFFTPGYTTASGEAISNKNVKDLIKSTIDGESHAQPLSDQEIVAILKKRGLGIARRTVAKYRGELNIPSSNDRKKPGAAPSTAGEPPPTPMAADAGETMTGEVPASDAPAESTLPAP
jgi:DNA-directed RNA polymerase specialized sigma54-like protein